MTYSGLGYYQPPPPPKPDRRPLWIALSVLGVLVVAGGVLTAVLLNRDSPSATGPATTSAQPAKQTKWQTVEDTQSGVSYELPESWELSGGGVAAGVRLVKSAVSRPFECQGRNMIQAQIGSGSVVSDSTTDVATEVAKAIAKGGYTVDRKEPRLGEPKVESESDEKAVVSIKAEPDAVNPCFSPKATVTAVAMRSGTKVSVVVLNVAEGGPHVAEGPSADEVAHILESVQKL
ncbi:hypothetical protein [Saccharothrix variisporea]|uniref:DUF8017 domain-containing protein n=1 Tax=Saccharothrix variisporea TaxID=543527 RepID=A0A495XHB6_9PSEU|nr:hypothetical protein [Saccharothrix variisporea]RKT73119.1 hypothetical protein DFJ66_6446 [Saccharothrix variisporea]